MTCDELDHYQSPEANYTQTNFPTVYLNLVIVISLAQTAPLFDRQDFVRYNSEICRAIVALRREQGKSQSEERR